MIRGRARVRLRDIDRGLVRRELRRAAHLPYRAAGDAPSILDDVKSFRGQLFFFWVLLLAVCVALGAAMVVLFR